MASVAEEDTRSSEPKRAPSEALVRLRRGEISLSAYLDACTERTVQPFKGRVSEAQLDFLMQLVREQLSTDPTLTQLVHRTTGMVSESSTAPGARTAETERGR
jgi:hypothetical protein